MKKRAFTLIELLIVIAIILILIAIALPNFLESQMRAKLVRVRGDVRSMAIAAISYQNDFGKYPTPSAQFAYDPDWLYRQQRLTTPIRYMTSLPIDIFRTPHVHNRMELFDFEVRGGIPDDWFVQDRLNPMVKPRIDVYIRSWGPDRKEELPSVSGSYDGQVHRSRGWSTTEDVYCATNGTLSRGDLWGLLPGPIYY